MNPKTRKFKVNQCEVCDYPFSDAHHLYPQHDGGEETIYLCPNHHRFANIVQVILKGGGWKGEKILKEFAEQYFDKQFNERMLTRLIIEYYSGASDAADRKETEEMLTMMTPEQRDEYYRITKSLDRLKV